MEVMEELTKQIKRDLFDIRENINNPDKLMQLFSFSSEEFDSIIHNLKFSVEESLFEFKSTAINLILEPLQSLQYDSKALTSYRDQIERTRSLLAVTLIQRLIAVGAIKISESKSEESYDLPKEAIEQPGIGEILAFVQKELKTNPESHKNPLLKKIVMHVKIYQNETQKMKDLTSKVSTEKKAALKKNFDIILAGQVSKMREAYNELINSTARENSNTGQSNILLRFDFKPMGKFFLLQIEAYSRLLSTLVFAKNEKFHTREILLSLTKEQQELLDLVKKERMEYTKIAPFDTTGMETAKAFSRRIVSFLEREKEWLKIHPGRQ